MNEIKKEVTTDVFKAHASEINRRVKHTVEDVLKNQQ